jgi:hypothetical protein
MQSVVGGSIVEIAGYVVKMRAKAIPDRLVEAGSRIKAADVARHLFAETRRGPFVHGDANDHEVSWQQVVARQIV